MGETAAKSIRASVPGKNWLAWSRKSMEIVMSFASAGPHLLEVNASMLSILMLAVLTATTNAVGQTIYQCRNSTGHVTLQDRPCPGTATTELARKSISEQNAEYRSEPISLMDPKSQQRLTSGIVCPSLRQAYQTALANSQRAMLSNNPTQIQQASEAVQHAGGQISQYRCE